MFCRHSYLLYCNQTTKMFEEIIELLQFAKQVGFQLYTCIKYGLYKNDPADDSADDPNVLLLVIKHIFVVVIKYK